MNKLFLLILFSAISAHSFVNMTMQIKSPDFIWTGRAGGNNWSTAGNWSSNKVPGANDIAKFFGTYCTAGACNVTVNSAVSVKGIITNAAYAGTITQGSGNTVTVGTSGWVQAGGTFTGSNANVTVNGNFNLSAGTLTAPTTNLYLNKDVTISGGTFSHNNGTVVLASSVDVTLSFASVTFNNLTFSPTTSRSYEGTTSATVNGNVTLGLTAYFTTGLTFDVYGNISTTTAGGLSAVGPTTSKFVLKGNASGQTVSGGGSISGLVVDAGANNVTIGSIFSLNYIEIISGTVTGNGELMVSGIYTGLDNMYINDLQIYGVPGDFNDLGATTITVHGNLIMDNCTGVTIDNGTLSVEGNFTMPPDLCGGNFWVSMVGDGKSISANTPGGEIPNLAIITTGTINQSTDVAVTSDFIVYSGTYLMLGLNLSVGFNIGLLGTTIDKAGGTLSLVGVPQGDGSLFGGTVLP